MDIFDGNRKLEETTMYALDWGVFLRHNIDGPIAPFMYLFDGVSWRVRVRVLMTDGDPMEYAMKVLSSEEDPYQQFIVGMEGFLRDEHDQRTDAIIVQGFDKRQEKGVVLAQMIQPKEKGGTFKKIGKVTYLGSPDLPVDKVEVENPDYSVQEPGFNAMALEKDGLTQYMAFFTHDNPSVIASTMRRFLSSKLGSAESATLKGTFELIVTPGGVNNHDFLKFLAINAVEDERSTPHAREWESATGRTILVNIKHGDDPILTEYSKEEEGITETVNDVTEKPAVNTNPKNPTSSFEAAKKRMKEGKKPWWKFW